MFWAWEDVGRDDATFRERFAETGMMGQGALLAGILANRLGRGLSKPRNGKKKRQQAAAEVALESGDDPMEVV